MPVPLFVSQQGGETMTGEGRKDYQRLLMNLFSVKPVAYFPAMAKRVGGVKAAVMLSQLLYWHGMPTVQERGGWFYKSVEEMEAETGLSKYEQQAARQALASAGVVKVALKGLPKAWHYRVEWDALLDRLSDPSLGGHVDGSGSEENPPIVGRKSLPTEGCDASDVGRRSHPTLKGAGEYQDTTQAAVAAAGWPEIPDETPEGTQGARAAFVSGLTRQDEFPEIQEYPEDVRPLLRAMVGVFPVPVPDFRSSKGKFWTTETRSLAKALAGFDAVNVFVRVRDRVGKSREHMTISGPQSLYSFVADEVRVIRTEQKSDHRPAGWMSWTKGGENG